MLEALDTTELAQTNLLQSGSKVHASTEARASSPPKKAALAAIFSSVSANIHTPLFQLMIMLLAYKVGWTNSQTQTFRSYLSPNVHDSDESGTRFAAVADAAYLPQSCFRLGRMY